VDDIDLQELRDRLAEYDLGRRAYARQVEAYADRYLAMAIDALDKAKSIREERDPPPSADSLSIADQLEALARDTEQREAELNAEARRALDKATSMAQRGAYSARQMEILRKLIPIFRQAQANGTDPMSIPEVVESERALAALSAELKVLDESAQ